MSAYCTQSDVEFRCPPEQLPRPARLVSVSVSTDACTLDGHGIADESPISFRAESGGSLPAPLSAGTTYYAIRLTGATFQISTTAGGDAIDLTTAGESVLVVKEIPWDQAITWASAMIDDSLVGSAPPLTSPYPQIVTEVAAELAAEWLRQWAGVRSAQLAERISWAQTRLDRWSKGVPIRGTNAPESGNTAVRTSFSAVDVRGWVRKQGSIP